MFSSDCFETSEVDVTGLRQLIWDVLVYIQLMHEMNYWKKTQNTHSKIKCGLTQELFGIINLCWTIHDTKKLPFLQ